jgi:hypothetical protein
MKLKIQLVTLCIILSIIGFMVKLPSSFRHIDKELHALFYFLAAAFLNILFVNKKILIHLAIFLSLLIFGIFIEYSQELSNKIFHKKIHGRFDIEDVQSNLKGLVLFSLIWLAYTSVIFVYKRIIKNDK